MRLRLLHGGRIVGEIQGWGPGVFLAVAGWVDAAEAELGSEIRFDDGAPWILEVSARDGKAAVWFQADQVVTDPAEIADAKFETLSRGRRERPPAG